MLAGANPGCLDDKRRNTGASLRSHTCKFYQIQNCKEYSSNWICKVNLVYNLWIKKQGQQQYARMVEDIPTPQLARKYYETNIKRDICLKRAVCLTQIQFSLVGLLKVSRVSAELWSAFCTERGLHILVPISCSAIMFRVKFDTACFKQRQWYWPRSTVMCIKTPQYCTKTSFKTSELLNFLTISKERDDTVVTKPLENFLFIFN